MLFRSATVQNPYTLVNRTVDNGLDEMMYRQGVSLLAYSPLGFGLLTGKYDETGFDAPATLGRMARFQSMKGQRWGRPGLARSSLTESLPVSTLIVSAMRRGTLWPLVVTRRSNLGRVLWSLDWKSWHACTPNLIELLISQRR